MKDTLPFSAALLLTCSLVLGPAACGQLLTVESWVSTPANPVTGSFFPSESIDIRVSGLDPLQPLSLILGAPLTPQVPVPGVSGMLGLAPSSLQAVGPFDGLGLLGPPFLGIRSSATGTFSARITLPRFPQVLPITFAMQVMARRGPLAPGTPFAFTNVTLITLIEPPSPPSVSAVFPSVVKEGIAPVPSVIMQGASFFDRLSVSPRVFFSPADGSPLESEALAVQVIDGDSGPLRDPLLLVSPPSRVGPAVAPPLTSAGPMRIRVSYAGLGIYSPNNSNDTFITNPSGLADPSILVFQTGLSPVVTDIYPKAGLTTESCTVTLNAQNVLTPPQLIFIAPGSTSVSVAANARMEGDASIAAETDNFPLPGRHVAFIRNPDHHPSSSAQSSGVPLVEFFVFEPGAESSVDINAVSPSSMTEGSGPTSVTLSGTCPTVDGYSLLSPTAGPIRVLMGSRLGIGDEFVEVPVSSVVIPAPGQFSITVLVPSDPPGLNQAPIMSPGLSNAGTKHFLILTASCVNPNGNRHEEFSTVATSEPANRFVYESATVPSITSLGPAPVTRRDGGQQFTIQGTGFFSNADVLPSSDPSLVPTVMIEVALQVLPASQVEIIDTNSITFTMPDLSAALMGVSLPIDIRVVVTNPDGQSTPDVAADKMQVRPSLAPLMNRPIDFSGPDSIVVLNTGPLSVPPPAPNNTWVELNDLVIPAGRTLTAVGSAPLILRVRGNIRIDGTLDLSGSRFRVTPSPTPLNWPTTVPPPPAGGGSGGLRQPEPAVGDNGFGPLDPSGMGATQFFGTGGFGGAHDVNLGGGGGGGGMATQGGLGGGALSMPSVLLGGAGGGALILPMGTALPFPVLGAPNPLLNDFQPFGGGGGGGGGHGVALWQGTPPGQPTDGGFGGHGGGSMLIACDGTITVGATGSILLDGESGEPGAPGLGMAMQGGGGGGGSGGGLVLQALQGIIIENGGVVSAEGGLGGVGGSPGSNDGGNGSQGIIRFVLPITTPPLLPLILGAPPVSPVPDLTGF